MEAKKEANSSSSSSLTTDLFGSKEPSSSSALFDSMFPPPPKVHTKDYVSSEETKKNYGSTIKRDCLDKDADKRQNPETDMSALYQPATLQPCPLSSSIYYGGQDIIINTRTTNKIPGRSTKYNKDGEDDGLASTGNWWQGSVYY